MLVKATSSYNSDYMYVFSNKASKRNIKEIAYRSTDFDDNMFNLFALMFGLMGLIMGTVAALSGAVIVGLFLIPASCGLIYLPTRAIVGSKITGKRIQEAASDRQHSITFESEYSWKSPTETDSYAFKALDKATTGVNLSQLIIDQRIEKRSDTKAYIEYVTSNPKDQLFPKLKPVIDRYLVETAEADLSLVRNAKKASHEAIANTQALINEHAKETAAELADIITGHKEQQKFQANTEQEMADFTLSQLTISSKNKMVS